MVNAREQVQQKIREYFETKEPILRGSTVIGDVSAGEGGKTRLWIARVDVNTADSEWDPEHYALVTYAHGRPLGCIVVHRDALPKAIGLIWSQK